EAARSPPITGNRSEKFAPRPRISESSTDGRRLDRRAHTGRSGSCHASMPALSHTTVLADEAIDLLDPRAGHVYVDGTSGGGGHAARVLERSAPDGRLIALDRDTIALDHARARLAGYVGRVTWVHAPFAELDRVLDELGVAEVDGILLDVGVSSLQ